MPFDFRTPDQWTAPAYAAVVYANPIPVPSECIDFTPPELWPVIWKHYPEGIEMPARVPRNIWERHELTGSTPVFWKCYWGKLNNSAMKTDELNEHCVCPPTLSYAFWDDYFELFPKGHKSPK
jgi:hypothetical protein